MNRHPEHDTREHLLVTGEQLCIARGFTGMGLAELLRTAGVPKGSFYHYFRSKEAFGVAMLERYYQNYNHYLATQLCARPGEHRERLLNWYNSTLVSFCENGRLTNCLAVKLSAEVCDLSEDMRMALNNGSKRVIAQLAKVLDSGCANNEFCFDETPQDLAQVLYFLWLGASLQAKLTRDVLPLEVALAHVKKLLVVPGS